MPLLVPTPLSVEGLDDLYSLDRSAASKGSRGAWWYWLSEYTGLSSHLPVGWFIHHHLPTRGPKTYHPVPSPSPTCLCQTPYVTPAQMSCKPLTLKAPKLNPQGPGEPALPEKLPTPGGGVAVHTHPDAGAPALRDSAHSQTDAGQAAALRVPAGSERTAALS